MKITIDTKEDSKEEMQHAIDLLQRIVGGTATSSSVLSSSSDSSSGSDFNADMGAMSGFANMMNNESTSSNDDEDKDNDSDSEEETGGAQIQLY